MRWRWIRSGASGPALNMGLDEALLRTEPVVPTLRTYRWAPWSLSLGYFQEVDRERVRPIVERGFGLVRRPTGGRAIFHGDELTYAVVCPPGTEGLPRDAVGAYRVVHGAVVAALARFGVEASFRGDRTLLSDTPPGEEEFLCFYRSTEFDLVRGGRKIVGSAQRRTRSGFLMHGSIPVGPNPVSPRAADARTDPEGLAEGLAESFAAALGAVLEPGEATPDEAERARELAARRYSRDEWTFRRFRPASRE